MSNARRADYGIDAPGVIRNLAIFGAIGFLLPVFFPVIHLASVNIQTSGFVFMGICCGGTALWMYLYSTYGKRRHGDRILNLIQWKGNEQVLDVGTGRGLLMIGAAKRLSTGKATGIDVWNAEDLTNNSLANALANAGIEGVGDKVEIKNENAMQMSFADQAFDIIVSNLCLHNIYDAEGRRKACLEIARVLKPGGVIIISDFRHMKEYRHNFDSLGLKTEKLPAYLTTFPPLGILKVVK